MKTFDKVISAIDKCLLKKDYRPLKRIANRRTLVKHNNKIMIFSRQNNAIRVFIILPDDSIEFDYIKL